MQRFNRFGQVAAAVGCVLTVGSASARADLVYDQTPTGAEAAITDSSEAGVPENRAEDRTEDREDLRGAVIARRRAPAPAAGTVYSEDVAPTPAAPAAPVAPYAVTTVYSNSGSNANAAANANANPTSAANAGANAQNENADLARLPKADLMRRERVREELKNEDILQERLENLRLRDEKRRTDQILVEPSAGQAAAVAAPAPAVAPVAPVAPAVVPVRPYAPASREDETSGMSEMPEMSEERVAPPVTETSGRSRKAKQTKTVRKVDIEADGDEVEYKERTTASSTLATSTLGGANSEKTPIKVSPRFGVAGMRDDGSLSVSSRFMAGLGVEVAATDNLGFELAYSYGEYGVSLANGSEYYNPNYYNDYETISMKQNVVDAGLKFYFLGSDSRLRPFLGGGAAYSKSYVNYNQDILDWFNQYGYAAYAKDYEISSFLGHASAGLDVRLSDAVSVGGAFRYYTVLTSSGSDRLYYPVYDQKKIAGGALARSGFYSIMANASFSF